MENHNADHESGNFNLYTPSFTGDRISNDAYTYISGIHTVLDSEKERRRKCIVFRHSVYSLGKLFDSADRRKQGKENPVESNEDVV